MTVTWDIFPLFAWAALALWLGALVSFRAPRVSAVLGLLGWLAVAKFIVLLWISLGRPPLRTMGETRLWYAALLPACGFLVEWRWGIRWLRNYCLVMAAVFVLVNLGHPEAHDKTLMPALQSIWFVPHVIVYLIAYALLGASALAALRGLWARSTRPAGSLRVRDKGLKHSFVDELQIANNLVVLGFVFLTAGTLSGMVWAKEAWGHYWTWDPKETWAFLTWALYLVYIHLACHRPMSRRSSFWFIAGGFAVLLVCWFGLNYMSAGTASVHTYTR